MFVPLLVPQKASFSASKQPRKRLHAWALALMLAVELSL